VKLVKTEYCNCLALCKELFLHPTLSKNGVCIVCGHYTVINPNVHTDKKFEEELDKKIAQQSLRLERQMIDGNIGRPFEDNVNVTALEQMKMIRYFIKEVKI